ncbi:MAG TPA: carbamate kinase [Streptosporangiaceae bacterium]|jgi:carbamate kinase|nr:carbamate kinase [Streptosporangiaceae bacterium]
MAKTAVIALGGNALTRAGQPGTYDEMLANAAVMAAAVNEVIESGWRVVIVHGNGPQVGNLALQQEATTMVPAQPLALLNAMTQGELGSVIACAIDLLRGPGTAAALVTHVTVDPADPAFQSPSKPIGPFFERSEAQQLAASRGWVVKPDSGRGYRRVVASPEPTGVIEIDALRALVSAGHLVIAAGGGGIPVADAGARGVIVDAVIDKDRAAGLIARLLGAQALLLVTAVDRVMLDYGTPKQSELGTITVAEAARYLDDGQFPPGSMGPKIESALRFLADGGELAVVTSPGLLAATLAGGQRSGTRIERSPSQAGPGWASR